MYVTTHAYKELGKRGKNSAISYFAPHTLIMKFSPFLGNPVEGERDSGLKLNAIPL
jgi:hypothetical protein